MNQMQKKTVDQVINTLKKSFYEWEYIYKNGTNDPLWSDGINLNLIRKQIIISKKQIELFLKSNKYPEIYYKPEPPLMDEKYMVNADQIQHETFKNIQQLNNTFDSAIGWAEISITTNGGSDTDKRIIAYIDSYRDAYFQNDLVSMRKFNNDFKDYYKSMKKMFGQMLEQESNMDQIQENIKNIEQEMS